MKFLRHQWLFLFRIKLGLGSAFHLKNVFLTFNPTSNLFATSVKIFHSLANNFSMLMMPLITSTFFFSEKNFLVVAILIETFLFAFWKKLKQHSTLAAMEHSFNWTFANRTFLKLIFVKTT